MGNHPGRARSAGRKHAIRTTLIALALASPALALPLPAHAGAASKVYLPKVEYRDLEFEFRGGWQDYDGTRDGDGQEYVFDVGYGVTQRWFTELSVVYSSAPGQGGQVEEYKSENIFLLTEPGKRVNGRGRRKPAA